MSLYQKCCVSRSLQREVAERRMSRTDQKDCEHLRVTTLNRTPSHPVIQRSNRLGILLAMLVESLAWICPVSLSSVGHDWAGSSGLGNSSHSNQKFISGWSRACTQGVHLEGGEIQGSKYTKPLRCLRGRLLALSFAVDMILQHF